MMVAPTSFFNDYGGHIRILEESLALKSLGHTITIVTYYQGHNIADLDIRRTRSLPWRAEYEVGSSRHKIIFDAYLLAKSIKEGLILKPDLIHGHMHEGAFIGSVIARILRIPLIFDFQGGLSGEMVDHGFLNPDGAFYPWVRRLEKSICHLPDAILTSSLRAEDLLANDFAVQKERIYPLPDCVDTVRFDPDRFSVSEKEAVRKQLNIPAGKPIVAYLGLLADYQGTPELIQAAEYLHKNGADIHFLIMGYPRVGQYKAMAKHAGVEEFMTFTGKVPYDLAPRYLALGDIAISTKMSATEGSGKVLNYMAMAQPVVAFDTPVHREYLGDLGVYARVRDVPSLAKSIQSLIEDPDRCRRIGNKLRARAKEKYSWSCAGSEISKIYSTVLDR
jgi:glycosyltransferase involved in cell wall biosynthesis